MKSRRKVKDIDSKVESFGKNADNLNQQESKAVFKRYTFSLTEFVSDEIDDLTLIAKRVSRSDVVKAGIQALKKLPKNEQVKLVAQLK